MCLGRTAAGVLVLVLVATGCIGAVDRAEFDAEIQARGGGFSQLVVTEAVGAVAAQVGTSEFEITSMGVNPADGIVDMRVRNPADPRNLDDYQIVGGSVRSVEPVRIGVADDLDGEAFPITAVALDALDAMSEEALRAYDVEGGYVTGLQIRAIPSGEPGTPASPLIVFSLESPRSMATALFAADGAFIEVQVQ